MSPSQFRSHLTRQRDYRLSVWTLACVIWASGCIGCFGKEAEAPKPYIGRPWEATILIDMAFDDSEMGKLVVGFDGWNHGLTGKNVVLRIGRISHQNAITASAPTGWIYVIRIADSKVLGDEHWCDPNKLACWRPGWRHIYVAAGSLHPWEWVPVAGHELGHAMGLDHCPSHLNPTCEPPSIMGESTDKMTSFPSQRDFDEFCRINGCSR